VLLSGEAGIGKSRLTAALLERLASEPHTRLRYFCSPQHTDSAFYPIISQMERAAGLAHDDTPQARLDKLDALLAQTSTSMQDAALFALAKLRRRSKHANTRGTRPRSIALPGKSNCCRQTRTRRRRKRILSAPSPSRISSKPSPGNSAHP
jgi:hypothetical protein